MFCLGRSQLLRFNAPQLNCANSTMKQNGHFLLCSCLKPVTDKQIDTAEHNAVNCTRFTQNKYITLYISSLIRAIEQTFLSLGRYFVLQLFLCLH